MFSGLVKPASYPCPSCGFLVFDDYAWSALGHDPLLRPGAAVDAFLTLVDGKYELVAKADQLAVRKTSV